MVLVVAFRLVTGVSQHAPQIDDLLGVDVLVRGRFEGLCFCSEGDEEPTAGTFFDGGDGFYQRQDGSPLDVVADRVFEDVRQGVAVMTIEM